MDTLNRSVARTPPATKIEIAGYVLVAVGYVVMTLGILEIGGLFNIGIGFAVAWAGCVLMFLGEERREFDEEAEFRRSSNSSEAPRPGERGPRLGWDNRLRGAEGRRGRRWTHGVRARHRRGFL